MTTETAFKALYDEEFIAGYERNMSVLYNTCTNRGLVSGNTFIFDVIDSGSAVAVTRGVNGLIPTRGDNNTTATLQMAEYHDIVEKTGFNIFSSQADQRAAMQMTGMAVINRKIDDLIITQLATATNDVASSAVTLSVDAVVHALVILGNNNVPLGTEVYGLITPAGWGYLLQTKEITSADYVDNKMLIGAPMQFMWAGVKWMVHTGLPGIGTSAETLFVYHKSAIGAGMNTGGIQNQMDYDKKQDLSWVRHSFYGGSKLLQNAGVVTIPHDGSAFAAF